MPLTESFPERIAEFHLPRVVEYGEAFLHRFKQVLAECIKGSKFGLHALNQIELLLQGRGGVLCICVRLRAEELSRSRQKRTPQLLKATIECAVHNKKVLQLSQRHSEDGCAHQRSEIQQNGSLAE